MKREQIAAYIRLSKEDDKHKEESNSVIMQRMLLKKYVSENFANYDLMEFCDDGYKLLSVLFSYSDVPPFI